MQVEELESDRELGRQSLDSKHYLCQNILLNDHDCSGQCLNYYRSFGTINKLRLVQERNLNYSLQHDEAIQFCSQLIQQNNQITPTAFSKSIQATQQYEKDNQKASLQQNSYFHLSSLHWLILKKLKQLNFELDLECNQTNENLFWIEEQHSDWINQYLVNSNQTQLSSMQHIFNDFLNHFKLSKNQISQSSFIKIVKSMGISYKLASKINFKATTRVNKSKQYVYALTIFYHIKQQKEIIYIDETGLGKDYIRPKVWCKKNQSFFIDRMDIRDRINIIGGISKDLLLYQCVRCNVNAELIKNYLIKLVHVCNQQYGLSNYVFVFDNASVHKENNLTKEVLKICQSCLFASIQSIIKPY
ncbi:unnamed protein product [Paramecium octaurelia]|uniref:Tc1-like transposase DDE domain-containing protein n=1 Tax=Paramecium octaurelia TaxID=43137 RepID=A0A8S1WER7_PAROT|nr:unnamed protein product [Paramecium octaurelia]